MMSAQKRKSRLNNTSGANRGGGRQGGRYEKTCITEGVFANARFTHVATSLLGCVVQLQVKNGRFYEGILKTYSPSMDIVLEMAHLCEDSGNNNQNAVSIQVPSKDSLIEKILFKVADILSICALNVDMELVVKDSFTDTAISSKLNGQVGDKELRELQPWDGEDGEEISGLEGDSSNGWDPNDMFRTNEKQFNVKSTYDDKLTQYTTPLDKSDSSEYKAREEHAQRLAQEIEKSDGHKSRTALENGDENEEDKFSAVVRPQENNSQTYIIPNKRNQHHNQYPPRSRGGGHINNHQHPNLPNRGGHHQHPPPQQMVPQPNRITSPNRQQVQQVQQQIHHPPPHPVQEEPKLNNNIEKDDRRSAPVEVVPPPPKPSPIPEPTVVTTTEKPEPVAVNTSPVNKVDRVDRRNSDPRGQVFSDLKEFKNNFKLDKEKKEKEDKIEEKPPEEVIVKTEIVEEKPVIEPEQEERTDKEKSVEETVKNSNLNPNAKEFQPKPLPQQPQQIPTPPRPQAPSPIVPMPAAQVPAHNVFQIPQYNVMMQPNMQSAVVSMHSQNPQQQLRQTKRATVSIHGGPRPDLNAAAAQAATGQPLLAHSVHPTPHPGQYILQMAPPILPQPASYQMGQVMPMPSAGTAVPPGSRMTTTSGVQMVPTSHTNAIDHNNQSHSGSMYMTHSGPVPAHVPFPHPTPTHTMGPPQSQQHQHQQGAQINPQQNTNHPAPSPVQQQGPSGQSHTQGHPPTTGTPQPHPPYQQMNIQAHPPLQPSPHHPTSPQNMHPMSQQYFHSHPSAAHMQGNQQFSVTQTLPPSSAGHSLQGQSHMNHAQHQIVVMPPHQHNQVQQNPGQQPQHQFQQGHTAGMPHMVGHGQGHINYQPGVHGLQTNNPNNLPQHMNFVPQVPQVHISRKGWISYKTGMTATLTRL